MPFGWQNMITDLQPPGGTVNTRTIAVLALVIAAIVLLLLLT
ncbi:MAG: hypothetical protein JWM62_2770 [Frankiales bacterium]|nr:hypothetical protein [Frankiales bacterium]